MRTYFLRLDIHLLQTRIYLSKANFTTRAGIAWAIQYQAKDWGIFFDSQHEQRMIFFTKPVLEPTQPPTQWVSGAIPPGIRRPRREANQLHSATAKDNNRVCIPPLPSITSRCDASLSIRMTLRLTALKVIHIIIILSLYLVTSWACRYMLRSIYASFRSSLYITLCIINCCSENGFVEA
jgi:hypothetical protein